MVKDGWGFTVYNAANVSFKFCQVLFYLPLLKLMEIETIYKKSVFYVGKETMNKYWLGQSLHFYDWD